MRQHARARWAAVMAGALVLTTIGAAMGGPPPPDPDVEVLATFDGPGRLPEGVDVDAEGSVYVTLGPPFFVVPSLFDGYGAVQRISPDGTRETLVEFPDGPAPAGVLADDEGRVVFAVPDPGGTDSGVYVWENGQTQRIAGTEGMVVPNGLALARDGSILVTDSILGQIVTVPPEAYSAPLAGTAEVWLEDELLRGCDANEAVGANGIAVHRGDLYVANTSRGALVKVPVNRDGSPGEPTIVAGDASCAFDGLYGLDGIAVDARGTVYAAVVLQHRLVTIDPRTGVWTDVLDETDGLWNASSLVFGSTGKDRHRLYIANYSVLPPEPPASVGPAVLTMRTGVPGWPLG